MYDDLSNLAPERRADLDLPDALIRRALRAGDLVAVRRGVLVGSRRLADAVTPVDRHILATQIAMRATPGPATYAALGSAGLLHGFTRLGQPPQRVRLYRSKGSRWRDEHVAVLVCGLPATHVGMTVHGVPATTPARTAVDLARWVSFRSGVVIVDSALRQGVDREQMRQVARDCARWPRIRAAREVIAFADRRAASALESVSRVAFHQLGLPAPELQKDLAWDSFGNPTTIVDFYWEEFRVVGEADGLLKYDDQEGISLRAEKLRQERLEDLGYTVVRWTWNDIWRRPDWVAGRLRRAFAGRRSAAAS